jgi:hypothetical protein
MIAESKNPVLVNSTLSFRKATQGVRLTLKTREVIYQGFVGVYWSPRHML